MRTSINTTKNENGIAVNNGFSFPIFTGSTTFGYYSSTSNKYKEHGRSISDKENLYVLCSDWVEFICTGEAPIDFIYRTQTNKNIMVEKISVHKNPNFRNLHRIYLHGVEVCDIFSVTNNGTHLYDEVSVKVANAILYTTTWVDLVRQVIHSLNLEFVRMARYDIALDGMELLKMDGILNKFTKSHTIQINNDAIKVLPVAFNKKELRWTGWSLGSKKSGISARYYDKTKEIESSGKKFINEFWKRNNISTEQVGRFEVQLNYKRLKKYRIDLNNMELLTNAEFLGTIFQQELRPWLKFYRVKRRDVLIHRKETAIRRGREINLIKWNHIPNKMELLEYYIHTPNSNVINARNTISFALHEIMRDPNTSTTAQADIIEHYAKKYHLSDYVQRKIKMLFGNEIEPQYTQYLQRFLHR